MVAEVGFYHLTRSRLEEALPKLLEKVWASGQRCILRCAGEERVDYLDRLLWTYDRTSFLPHGTHADGNDEEQPIFLTAAGDNPNSNSNSNPNPNGARVLVLVDGMRADDLHAFTRVLDLFDGRDEEAVADARRRWQAARDAGHALVYWQQNARGGWSEMRRVEGSGPSAPPSPPV